MSIHCHHRVVVLAAVLTWSALPQGPLRASEAAPNDTPAPGAAEGGADDPGGRLLRPDASKKLPGNGGGIWLGEGWLQMLAALAVVAALIFATRAVLKRLGPAAKASGAGAAIEVVAQTPLAPGRQLSLVRVGRRLVLVGSGPAGLRSLAELTAPQEVEEVLADARSAKPGAFAGMLARQKALAGAEDDAKSSDQVPADEET